QDLAGCGLEPRPEEAIPDPEHRAVVLIGKPGVTRVMRTMNRGSDEEAQRWPSHYGAVGGQRVDREDHQRSEARRGVDSSERHQPEEQRGIRIRQPFEAKSDRRIQMLVLVMDPMDRPEEPEPMTSAMVDVVTKVPEDERCGQPPPPVRGPRKGGEPMVGEVP